MPAGSTEFNVTVARAYSKLLGAFVTFRANAAPEGVTDLHHPSRRLHLVGLKALEREAGQVASAGADAAQGHARHALHWISCYEGASLAHVLGQAHVAEGGTSPPSLEGSGGARQSLLQDNVDIGAGRSASAIPGMRCSATCTW